jgi:choline-sulfatase
MNKPNILVIMSDEHDPAVTGCYGDPIVQTPNLDRLAAGGVTFDACYTTSPLCVPARLSFTAGKYVSRCGAWSNDSVLPSEDYPSLPRIMTAAGYESILGGKMHYHRHRRYGFNDIINIPDNENWILKNNSSGARRDPDSAEMNYRNYDLRMSKNSVSGESGIMEKDSRRTTVVCDFLSSRSKNDKPFFYLLGYIAPHFPLIAPQEYYDLYKDKVPLPNLPEGWFERLPTNYKQLIRGFGIRSEDAAVNKKARELYWALTSWMDTEIGKVLDALADSDVADNTVVIYTSDHGENKGDHGLWWKNNMYEHSARIPCIVSYPSRWGAGQRRTKACSLVDLVQTIAALGGAEAPEDWDGDSLVDYLDSADSEWKDFAVSEYYAHNISSGFAMLRQGRYKYVYHARMTDVHGPERELYDLENDPDEWNNLAGFPEHQGRMGEMHAFLVNEVGEDPELTEQRCRAGVRDSGEDGS